MPNKNKIWMARFYKGLQLSTIICTICTIFVIWLSKQCINHEFYSYRASFGTCLVFIVLFLAIQLLVIISTIRNYQYLVENGYEKYQRKKYFLLLFFSVLGLVAGILVAIF